MKTAKIKGNAAPHKAILLLSIMDLIECGTIHTPEVEYTTVLEDAFSRNWDRYVGNNSLFTATALTPFWHLKNEKFWSVKRKDGGSIDDVKYELTKTLIQSYKICGVIDEGLFRLLKVVNNSMELRKILLDTYLRHK